MKKGSVVLCTLGLSLGLLGTSFTGAVSDSAKSVVKEKAVTDMTVANNEDGVQPRWVGDVAKSVGLGAVGSAVYNAMKSGASAASNSHSSGTYASAGGLVGSRAMPSHTSAPADVPEFTRSGDEGVQPRWVGSVAKAVGQSVVAAGVVDALSKGVHSSDVSGYGGNGYASCGGLVGGRAMASQVAEFGR